MNSQAKKIPGTTSFQPYELDRIKLYQYLKAYRKKGLWEIYGVSISREIFEEYFGSQYKKLVLKSIREIRAFLQSDEIAKVNSIQIADIYLDKEISDKLNDNDCLTAFTSILECLKSLNTLKLTIKQNLNQKTLSDIFDTLKTHVWKSISLNIEKQAFNLQTVTKLVEVLNSFKSLTTLELSLKVTWELDFEQSMTYLLEGISKMKKIETLNIVLDDQKLAQLQVQVLSKSLESMYNLKNLKLSLARNPGIKSEIYNLSHAITKIVSLQSLSLKIEHCEIESQDFIKSFTKIADDCEKLEELDLSV